MTETYHTNENFFICITAGDFEWPGYVFDWFYQVPAARFRLIVDKDLDDQVANLRMVEEIYPGVETIGIVSNPWSKTVNAFKKLITLNNRGTPHPITQLFNFNISSFDNFVNQMLDFKSVPQVWFTPSTTATEWMTYVDSSNNLRTPKITLRKDYILEDFKQVQDFFCTDQPLVVPEGICPPSNEYKTYYSTETKLIISNIFKNDIERYGFSF
jgi:hypothetical protein